MPITRTTYTHDALGRLTGVVQGGLDASVDWSPDGHRLSVRVLESVNATASTCPSCTAPLEEGDQLCGSCGVRLTP